MVFFIFIHIFIELSVNKHSVASDLVLYCLPMSHKKDAILIWVNPLYSGYLYLGSLANSEDPDEIQHNAAFHQGLHCLLRLKQPSGTEIYHNLENSACDPLKYKMSNPILIVSTCMEKSIRIQRV